MRVNARRWATCLLIATPLCGGCVERRVWIDSEPNGALVWLNDAQVGRTPVDVSITHDGTYDLRIEKEGFEPLVTPATTEGPVWDVVPIDFVVEVLPIKARSETRWKFTLQPRNDSEEALVARASELRERTRTGEAKDPAAGPKSEGQQSEGGGSEGQESSSAQP